MKHTAKNILVGTIGAAGLFLASTATANADTTHTVAKNDTVWDLSQKYGVSIQSIEKLNNIDQNTHLIVTGQTLKVPTSNTSSTKTTSSEESASADTENTTDVTVQSGDTLWDLAQKYGTTVAKLRELNGLSADATLIHPGKVLKVNGTAQATQSTTTATTTDTTADQATTTTQTADTSAQTTTDTTDTTTQTQETQTPQVTVSANHTTYTVQAGDSLYSIAQAYGVTVDSLRSANTLGATLAVGQTLTINDPTKDPSATQQATQDTTAQSTQQTTQDTTAQSTQQAAQNTTTQSTQQATQSTTTQSTQQATQSSTTTQSTQQATQSTTTQSQTQATQSTQQTTTTTTASSVSGSAIAAYAQSFIGVPYVWGGTTPSGFDCSGLTQYVYAHFGKQIGRTTVAQESAGTRIPVSQAQVGDLLFWGSAGSTYHVAIYLGGNSYIAAPEPGQSVKVGNMAYFMPSFAVHVN